MTEPKILYLTLKKVFFDLIASGEKKEEYRDIKPYWVARLVDEFRVKDSETDFTFLHHGFLCEIQTAQSYDVAQFRNGYRKDSPTMEVEILDITDGFSKPEWADGDYKPCFIIKLGKILSVSNFKPQ